MDITDIKVILIILYLIFVILNILIIIRDKRDSVKALAWITVIALIPVIGFILYILFGRNHRKEKIFNIKESADIEILLETLSAKQIYDIQNKTFNIKEISENRDIITLLLNSNKSLLSVRNHVKIFNNGKETFEDIIADLKKARSFIHLEYYIFEKDKIGKGIAEILIDKARAGVEVRLIYDDVGSWGLNTRFLRKMRDAGVKVKCFMPVVFPWLTSKINYRNHRKIIVIDGKVGYTGGINIAQRYIDGTKMGIWRDTHLRIEGEAIESLQVIFITDWHFVSGEKLRDSERYFPQTYVDVETPVQIASSGPDSDWACIMQAFFAAITKAKKHIYISTPYFLPNEAILTAIKVASLSGVDVRILIPEKSDSKIVHWATRSYILELLEAKVKVYLYRKGFNHSKIIMIDGMFSSVGTANMDIRSFEDNFEITAILYDSELTHELERQFRSDLNDSVLVKKEEWEKRPVIYSIGESFASLLSPLL
ncbi:MAG: cardiolipin synthase [Rikenellaceae bacterium]|nr:cardiolipin synthase [Rikenellaceae bacterium]